MFDFELSKIVKITERVLGPSRNTTNIDGWNEYNCPYCADIDNVESDGKHNCCVHYRNAYFHCWKCGTSGNLSKVLRDYGGSRTVKEYLDAIKSIRDSMDYQLQPENAMVKKELKEDENMLTLPEGFRPLSPNDKEAYAPYRYLRERGLDDRIIKEFRIGYVPWSDNFMMRCRVVVPSYDQYDNLNYYVARDYTGRQKLKYINAKVNKKSVVFNEQKINWCENVTLCEGVFDSFAIPNSIPLLGKVINKDFAVYKALMEKARANVNILLDDDAEKDAKKMYSLLNDSELRGRIRLISCPTGYDAASFFQEFGPMGTLSLMRRAKKMKESDLIFKKKFPNYLAV